jgi:hypothetical protein
LELPQFFRRFFPIGDVDELREETFALYYYSTHEGGGGITYGDVQDMEASERHWNLKRISQQKRHEADAMRSAQARARRRR